MSLSIYNPNLFAYPGNRLPGFNLSHPAASNIGASIVPAVGQNVGIDILKPGATLTQTTVTSNAIDPKIGPVTVHSATRYRYDTGLFSTAAPAGITLAVFFANASLAAGIKPIMSIPISGISNSYSILLNSGVVGGNWNGASVSSGFAAVSASHSYFLVVSVNTSTTNFVLLDLTNGSLLKSSTTGATFTTLAGGVGVGLDYQGNVFTGNVGASMGSLSYNSMPTLLVWAADPWAFWYPRTLTDTMFDSVFTSGGSLQGWPDRITVTITMQLVY